MKRLTHLMGMMLALFICFAVPTALSSPGKGGLTPNLAATPTPVSANVMDFGAIGDGVANDLAAFEAARDSLPSAGGTIFAPCGNYKFTSTSFYKSFALTSSNQHLLGEGECTSLEHDYLGAGGGGGWTVTICSNPAQSCCIDLYDTGGPPQTSGDPDNLCDNDGSTDTSFTRLDHNSIKNLRVFDDDPTSCGGWDGDSESCTNEESHGLGFYSTDYSVVEDVWCDSIGDECIGINRDSSNYIVDRIFATNCPSVPAAGGAVVSVSNSIGPGSISRVYARNAGPAPNGTCIDGDGCPNIGSVIHFETVGSNREVANIDVRDVDIDVDLQYGFLISASATSSTMHNFTLSGGRIIVDHKDVIGAIALSGTQGIDQVEFSDLHIEGPFSAPGAGKTNISLINSTLTELRGDEDEDFSNTVGINSGIVGFTVFNVSISGFEGQGVWFDGNARNNDFNNVIIDEVAWGTGGGAIGFFTGNQPYHIFRNITIYGKPKPAVCTAEGIPAKCCTGSGTGCDVRVNGEQYAATCVGAGDPVSCCDGAGTGCDTSLTESGTAIGITTTSAAEVYDSKLFSIPKHGLSGSGFAVIQNNTINGYGLRSSGGPYHGILVSRAGAKVIGNTVLGYSAAGADHACISGDTAADIHFIRNTTYDCGDIGHLDGTGTELECYGNIMFAEGSAPTYADCDTESGNTAVNY